MENSMGETRDDGNKNGKPTCFEATDKPIADARDATALPHHNDGRSTRDAAHQSPPSRPHTYPGSRTQPIIVNITSLTIFLSVS